jgi:hypothetical protein
MRIALPRSILTLILALGAPALGAAAPPDWQGQMNYQGQLSGSSGIPVADGAYSITFKIYRDPTSSLAGDLVWTGETQSINVSRGLFNVFLGEISPLPHLTGAQLAEDCYLSVKVAGEPAEMLPRQKLLPAFFARSAFDLQGLRPDNTANNLVVLTGGAKIPAAMVNSASLSLPLDLSGPAGTFTLRAANECSACYGAVFNNLSATAASTGAALRVGGRIAAPDIVNTFVASAGVISQVVPCSYCKAGDEVFLQPKGDMGNTPRCWIDTVNNGSFTVGYSGNGLGSSISMAYLVLGDF